MFLLSRRSLCTLRNNKASVDFHKTATMRGLYAPITGTQRYYMSDESSPLTFYSVHAYAHGHITTMLADWLEWVVKPVVNVLYYMFPDQLDLILRNGTPDSTSAGGMVCLGHEDTLL